MARTELAKMRATVSSIELSNLSNFYLGRRLWLAIFRLMHILNSCDASRCEKFMKVFFFSAESTHIDNIFIITSEISLKVDENS